MKPTSKRFSPTTWTERLVPLVLGLLLLVLIITLALVALSLTGFIP